MLGRERLHRGDHDNFRIPVSRDPLKTIRDDQQKILP